MIRVPIRGLCSLGSSVLVLLIVIRRGLSANTICDMELQVSSINSHSVVLSNFSTTGPAYLLLFLRGELEVD